MSLLNIAQASGRISSLDNAKHFTIARGSALECQAILDACFALQILGNNIFDEESVYLLPSVRCFQSFA